MVSNQILVSFSPLIYRLIIFILRDFSFLTFVDVYELKLETRNYWWAGSLQYGIIIFAEIDLVELFLANRRSEFQIILLKILLLTKNSAKKCSVSEVFCLLFKIDASERISCSTSDIAGNFSSILTLPSWIVFASQFSLNSQSLHAVTQCIQFDF